MDAALATCAVPDNLATLNLVLNAASVVLIALGTAYFRSRRRAVRRTDTVPAVDRRRADGVE